MPTPNKNSPGLQKRGRPPRTAVYERLHTHLAELRDRLGGLPSPVEAQGIWHGIWLEEAHHSTAIEGNTLVLKQVEALLAEGQAVGNKDLSEYLEVQGYANAADWVYAHAADPGDWSSGDLISLTELRHVHRLVLTPVWDVAPHPAASENERPGSFREHEIEPFPGGMKPSPWPQVPAEIADWIGETRSLVKIEGVIDVEALAMLHARFERIHPFIDGNGRVGRLALNLLFIRLGFPPAIVYKRDRVRYMAALRSADGGDHGPLGELLARAILDNLHRFVMPAVAGPMRLVPLQALATTEISANALRVAATRGRLEASKGADGSWRSTRAWVQEYLDARYRRAGRP